MSRIKVNKQQYKTFDNFLNFCKVKNLRERTVKSYTEAWKSFNKIYKGNICDIKQTDIDGFILALKDRLKPVSINSYLRHLKAIFRYLELDIKIQLLKIDHEFKTPYNKEEIKKLLKKPDIKKTSFTYYRDWVIINTFLATGARANTIVNIKIQDLDLDNRFIGFTTLKNRKIKRIPIPTILVQILKEYLDIRCGELTDYLFCNHSGSKLSVNGLGQSIENYNHSRGIEKTGLHLFRHTFAKEFITNGGDILSLQHMLTHATLEQTRQYINMLDVDVQDLIKINPLETFIENNNRIKIK